MIKKKLSPDAISRLLSLPNTSLSSLFTKLTFLAAAPLIHCASLSLPLLLLPSFSLLAAFKIFYFIGFGFFALESLISIWDIQGVVQAYFAFFDPKPDEFHGVKVLLKTYLDDKQWDLSGFVDLILGQTTVGTVIKIEEDEDDGVYAVATALNLGRYKDYKCIMELKEFLLKVCQEERILHELRAILEEQAHDVGLLISQRVANLPPQLLPPLYDALFDEVSWATEDEPTEDLRNSFCFKSYLFVSKIYKHKECRPKTGSDE